MRFFCGQIIARKPPYDRPYDIQHARTLPVLTSTGRRSCATAVPSTPASSRNLPSKCRDMILKVKDKGCYLVFNCSLTEDVPFTVLTRDVNNTATTQSETAWRFPFRVLRMCETKAVCYRGRGSLLLGDLFLKTQNP